MRKIGVLLAFFTALATGPLFAQDHHNDDHGQEATEPDHGSEGFNAGETIVNHILDAHEIHFFTLHEGTSEEHHVSIPLPVIMMTENGTDIFSSSVFHHEHIFTGPSGTKYEMHHGHVKPVDKEAKITDLSLTKNSVGVIITVLILILLFGRMAGAYKKRPGQAPKGLQNLLEPLVIFIRDEVAKPTIGEKKYARYMPFLLTLFFFILVANMLGLIPFIGGFNIAGSIAVPIVLALLVFIITTVSGNKSYWGHVFWPPGVPIALMPIMIPIEILGVVMKPLVLTLRLFANITAGHIVILSFTCLIFIFADKNGAGVGYGVSIGSLAFTIFINFLELLVAFLQAYVFTLLAAIYFGAATEEHEHH